MRKGKKSVEEMRICERRKENVQNYLDIPSMNISVMINNKQ